MKKDEHVGKYMEVWGDTVAPGELGISALICVVTTMVFFLAGRQVLLGIGTLDPGLAKGYSLLVGIVGCFLGASICARKFKPKRRILVQFEEENIEDILKAAGMTVEEEIEALRTVSPEIIREMEELELYSILQLVPEDSPNYKPEYREKAAAKGASAVESAGSAAGQAANSAASAESVADQVSAEKAAGAEAADAAQKGGN